MHLFYIEKQEYINREANIIVLKDDEAYHAIKVLRLNTGDKVSATDGLGNWYNCEIIQLTKKDCLLKIISQIENRGKYNYRIHIAVAPTKNIKRFEWFLEKATEIGIDEITPIITFHSERRELKIERSVKVITSAMKQSLKSYHPKLNDATKFKDFLKTITEEERYIAHLIDEHQDDLKNVYKKNKDVCILIGPEGDFSEEEVQLAQDCGFKAVRMGNERLRTETAALFACNTIHFKND